LAPTEIDGVRNQLKDIASGVMDVETKIPATLSPYPTPEADAPGNFINVNIASHSVESVSQPGIVEKSALAFTGRLKNVIYTLFWQPSSWAEYPIV
jgi:hypothetical protein